MAKAAEISVALMIIAFLFISLHVQGMHEYTVDLTLHRCKIDQLEFFFWDSLRWGSKLFIQGNSVWEVRPSSKQKQKVHQLEFFLCDILWRVPCNAQIRFFILILSCELLCMLQYQIWLLPRWNKLLILNYFIAQNYTSLPCMYLVWIQDHREPTKEQISRYHRGQGFYKCIIRPRQP
jgi:hypothetical protein